MNRGIALFVGLNIACCMLFFAKKFGERMSESRLYIGR